MEIIDWGFTPEAIINTLELSKNAKFIIWKKLGPTVKEWMPKMTRNDALNIGIQLINAFEQIHKLGFVHNNNLSNNSRFEMKPVENNDECKLVIVGFGQAKKATPTLMKKDVIQALLTVITLINKL
jgi:hypothetical protein